MAVYYMPPGFTPTIVSHGNSKSGRPFFPTLPSTVDCIKRECHSAGPKEATASVSSDVGGILDASCPGAIPRGEQQISYYKRRTKADVSHGSKSESNELYTIMLKAHMEDPDHQFVRDIKAYPEPSVFLASDQQLHDVVRFCTVPFEHCVLTVDPTFCLGDFDVTPATYRHLLLECKRTGHPPVMIGPTYSLSKNFRIIFIFCFLHDWTLQGDRTASSLWH